MVRENKATASIGQVMLMRQNIGYFTDRGHMVPYFNSERFGSSVSLFTESCYYSRGEQKLCCEVLNGVNLSARVTRARFGKLCWKMKIGYISWPKQLAKCRKVISVFSLNEVESMQHS
jgi:hypothetical protein